MTERLKNNKIRKVMKEFEEGKLYSGKGKEHKVTSENQAIAIALSEQRAYNKRHHVYHL